jgi:hypothetical protein
VHPQVIRPLILHTSPEPSMRPGFALAAAAALALAVPAAAQPDPGLILAGALEQAHQNVPAGVTDYLMTFTSGPVRTQLYVHRRGDGWEVLEQEDAPMGDMFRSMIVWADLSTLFRPGATGQQVAALRDEALYLGTDTVEGRPAHVLRWQVPGLMLETMEIPDTARVFVDAETRQLLRVAASVDVPPGEGGAMVNGGHVDMVMTYGGYETTGGLTLPRRVRMQLRMQTNLSDAQRTLMQNEMQPMLADLAADSSQEAAQTRLLMEMFLRMLDGEPMDVPATVEDVRVNPGRPEWAAEERLDTTG